MALTDLTRISTSGIATGSTIDAPILRKDVSFRGSQVGVTSALFDSSDNALEFNDNVKIKLGNGGDLELYHNGSDNYIDAKTGSLYFRNTLPTNTIFQTGNFTIKNQSNNQNVANFAPGANGGGLLYHENVLRFNTTSSGAVVTGILTATGFSGPLSNPSGISTFYDLRVTNNLTVEGTTSTLDTTLIGVDRVEVGANSNSIVGVAVTQSGTADIVNLFDGATKVVTVDDTGKVGLGTDVPLQKLHIEHDSFHQILLKRVGSGPSEAIFANAGNYTDIRNNASGVKFSVGSTPESKMVVRPVGVGIGTLIPRGDFHINDNNPSLIFSESDAAVDNKYWRTTVNGQTWTWDGLNDSLTSGNNNFRMTRSGNEITAFQGRVSGSTWFNVSNSTQRVGIGSATPENKLKINVSSGNDGMVVQNTSSANIAFIGARNGDATLQMGQYGSAASGTVFGVSAANLAFIYTTSYASTHPSALLIGNSSNKDVIFATNATARLSIKNDGKVLIGDDTTYDPQGMLHVVGDDNSNGPELYLQVPNNNTTDNIGALIFGNNVDKSIVKIQGVTHTANNTGDLTFHTSTTGTMSEKLRIDSLGRILYGLTSNFTGAKLQLNLGVGGSAINIFAASNDANAATLDLYKSRGTTPNNYTALQDGDFIGELRFRGTTGSSYVNGAVIQAKVNGTTGSGNDLPTDLIFRLQPDGSGNTGEVFRITSSGKVLVGDGNSVSPSRNLDVRGSGHQQILIGSTNNAGASLMVDGQGGGDGSGGLYCTFEAASDGHLKIRNYDPSKSIIFGTGSNTGSNDSVVIDSDGDLLIGTTTGTSDFHLTRTSGAVLHTIEATAAGGEALYKCLGKSSGNDAREVQFRYDSGADAHRIITANNIAIQLCTQNTPRLNIQGDGEVHLPTANYKFTENNFLSTSAATENGNTAQFTNAMTSMMGSYHSSNNTNGIMDFTDYKASDWTILEVYGKVNPNTAGSGAYSDPFYMTIYKGGGYDYGASQVVTTIFAVMHTPAARTFYSTGSGNNANDGITAVWYNGSSESVQFAHNNTNNAANYLRIKIPTGNFNTTYGMSFACRIFKRF